MKVDCSGLCKSGLIHVIDVFNFRECVPGQKPLLELFGGRYDWLSSSFFHSIPPEFKISFFKSEYTSGLNSWSDARTLEDKKVVFERH